MTPNWLIINQNFTQSPFSHSKINPFKFKMFDFNPKVEFLICHQTVISGMIFWGKKSMKNVYFLLLQQLGMLFLHTGSSKPVGRKKSLSSP